MARCVVQTSDGGYVLAGYTDSYGSDGRDAWLVKTDSSGNVQWNRTYGGASTDHAKSVVETSDGGYALAGRTFSFDTWGFWLVKTDSSGNAQWNRTYGGGNIGAYSLVQTDDGGYALAGTVIGVGARLVKTDATGNMQWSKTFGGPGVDGGQSVIQTNDGGFALAGYTSSYGAGEWDFLLIKVAGPPKFLISIVSPENKTYPVEDVPLTLTVDMPTSWIGYSLDGQLNVTVAGNSTLSGLLDGFHYVVVYANDTEGNMGVSSTVYFTVDTAPPNITDVSQTPLEDNVLPEDKVQVNATVTDDLSDVKQVTLNYTNGNGTWVNVNMTNLEGNLWNATIPKFPYCTNVTYVITAEDHANNTVTTEEVLGHQYQYHVIPEFPSLLLLSLFMITTLATTVYVKKRKKQ